MYLCIIVRLKLNSFIKMSKKIVAAGRLKNRSETTKLTSIHVDNDVLEWIEENTIGNKQLVFNHLLKKGIEYANAQAETEIIESLED